MKEIRIKIPTLDEMIKFSDDELQNLLVPKEEAEELTRSGVALYLVKDTRSVAPDGKTAVFNLYVVLGSETDLKNNLKYYYPE